MTDSPRSPVRGAGSPPPSGSTPVSPGTPDARGSRNVAEAAVEAALTAFARDGYAPTKLGTLSEESGVSKRMLHYHFGDKQGLYRAAMSRAVNLLIPPPEVLNRSYTVPVEGVRRFVDAIFHRFLQNPDAARLVIRENLDPVLDKGSTLDIDEVSEVVLHIERLLLLGQDSGAFRPDISAEDILVMVCSLCMFRESNSEIAWRITRVDMRTQRNIEGLRRMTIDAVLAFLTSNIPASGYESYAEPDPAPVQAVVSADDVYDIDNVY